MGILTPKQELQAYVCLHDNATKFDGDYSIASGKLVFPKRSSDRDSKAFTFNFQADRIDDLKLKAAAFPVVIWLVIEDVKAKYFEITLDELLQFYTEGDEQLLLYLKVEQRSGRLFKNKHSRPIIKRLKV